MKVTLYCIEYCNNNLGVWDRKWFLDPDDVRRCFDGMVKEEGFDEELTDGSYGSILPIAHVDVELTAEGVLAFANDFAVDTGAC